MTHTPGPWVASRVVLNFGRVITRADHADRPYGAANDPAMCRATYMQTIADVSRHPCHLEGGLDEAEANARLIAAAPELLVALKDLSDGMDRAGGDVYAMPECPWCHAQFDDSEQHNGDCELVKARAAIEKAEGVQ